MREAGGFRMGPFELMDLIGHDVNFRGDAQRMGGVFHDPRFLPSVLQRELVDAGFLGRKSGRGFYERRGRAKARAASEDACAAPLAVIVQGDLGPAAALVARWREAGIRVDAARPTLRSRTVSSSWTMRASRSRMAARPPRARPRPAHAG
jgi:3-hydroxybutyryl-CoA dehydrogenase